MRKLLVVLVLAMVAVPSMAALYDDNAGYDRNYTGDPLGILSPGVWSFFAAPRDNVAANGDTWLGANMGNFVKAPADATVEKIGAANGLTASAGFAGVYVGSSGDSNWMNYDFTAAEALSQIDFTAACTVYRGAGKARRLKLVVNVNGSDVQTFYTGYWSDIAHANTENLIVGTTAGTAQMLAPKEYSITGLNIQPGDAVKVKISMPANDSGGIVTSSNAKQLGLGVMFAPLSAIPEPATMSLLAIGGLGALIRRRR